MSKIIDAISRTLVSTSVAVIVAFGRFIGQRLQARWQGVHIYCRALWIASEGIAERARLDAGCAAEEFGIDRSYISDMERGKKNVCLPTMEVLAQGFEISLAKRELIRRQLEPVLPLLSGAIGRFIENPLRDALR